jgi:RNA polymerase sigma factor (sigma-70 family)
LSGGGFVYDLFVEIEPVTDLSDCELVEKTRNQGDKQAFGLLLERHHAGALRMAQRMIAHRDTARELVQEAMLEAYLSLASLEKPERFQSWLYGIVINFCRNCLRSRRVDPLSLEAMSGGLEATHALLISDAPDPQTMVEMRELHEVVLAAIDALSPPNRDAVLLYYYEQLSLQEISLTLGISMTAVKGRLHKSRRQLAAHFATMDDEPRLPHSRQKHVAERKTKMVEVQVIDVVVPEAEKQGHHIIILLDGAGQRLLPIWIGPFGAHYIATQLLGSTTPARRPMPYDFMASLLNATGAVLEEVQISKLSDITYYATARLRVGETVHSIDARPSDAIALALRLKSKITVAEEVLAQAGRTIPEKFQHKMPSKGLDQLAAHIEAAHQEQMAMLTKFKSEREEETRQATEKLFDYIFGE